MICSFSLFKVIFFAYTNYLDVSQLLAQYLPETTYSCDNIQSIPSTNTIINLPDWTCNEMNYTIFDFSRFTELEHLEIGNNSFGFVETFIIDGLNKLITLKIGENSFTLYRHYWKKDLSKSFHIKNCELLESIEIGGNSFSDYSGEFELSNLPLLQSIIIGGTDEEGWSGNFVYSSFVVRDIIDMK